MTGVALSAGVALLAAQTAAVIDLSYRVARRWWPGDRLGTATATILLSMVAVIVLLEVLGTAGLLDEVFVGAAVVVAWLGARRLTRAMPPPPAMEGRSHAPRVWIAVPAICLLWLLTAWALTALAHPRPEFDVVAGHLPVAVQWLQAGSTRIMPYVSPVSIEARYPGNSELLALWLMLPVHRDFLVQLASLPGTALTACAVALAARELGARPVAGYACALLVPTLPAALRILVGTNMEDMTLAGGVAAAAAFTAVAARRPSGAALFCVGLAAGLAVGTRYAGLLATPAVLALALVVVARGARAPAGIVRGVGWIAAGGLLTGAYWYLRNLWLTGDPVFPQSVPWHHVQLAETALFPYLASYLQLGWAPADWARAAGDAWTSQGPVFILLVVAPLLPLATATWRRERDWVRWLWALAPLATLMLGFVALPGSAGFRIDGRLDPGTQLLTLRYAIAVLPVSAVALAVEVSRLDPQVCARLCAAGMAVVAAVSATMTVVPTSPARTLGLATAALALLVVGTAVAAVWLRPRPRVTALGALALVLLAAPAAPRWATHYDGLRAAAGMPVVDAATRLGPADGSVAVAGFCEIYGLYGADLRRRVEYLTGDDTGFTRPLATTYGAWLDSLRSRGVTALVVSRDACFNNLSPTAQAVWAASHPDVFVPVYRSGDTVLYRVNLARQAIARDGSPRCGRALGAGAGYADGLAAFASLRTGASWTWCSSSRLSAAGSVSPTEPPR